MGIRAELTNKGKEEVPILQKYEILDRIKQLPSDRDKALVSFLFLTGCRISEVCHLYSEPKWWKDENGCWWVIGNRKLKALGIQKKQIEIDDERGILMVYNVRTLKKKKHHSKIKNIPIVRKREEPLVEILINHLNFLGDEDCLFPITRQRAYAILKKVGLYNHYMRHLRLTNLVVEYGFSAHELKKFVNWSSTAPSDIYVHLNVEDLIKKMKG